MNNPVQSYPTGTITFLFTDVEGSTALWEQHPQEMGAAMARHDEIIEQIVDAKQGVIVKPRGEGDSRFVVFSRAEDGARAAVEIQRRLAEAYDDFRFVIKSRIGIHTGTADLRFGDYYGSSVNRCARIRSLGHGGQILLSQATAELVRDSLPDGVALQDMGFHRLSGLSREEHVFQLNIQGLPVEFSALKSLSAAQTNLPVPPTAIIGRQDEIRDLMKLLTNKDVRLVTLTGPGGMGKTRLSLEVAADLVETFPQGVFFVDLAPIDSPDLLATTIAQSMGIREGGGRAPIETLKDLLVERSVLIVLDNFEQIIPAAKVVGELLAIAPGIKFLVTSRIALHLRGEKEYPVSPLTVPAEGVSSSPEQLLKAEAVQLFVQQAQAVKPSFDLNAENASVVLDICRRLDGLPLAIEIAAVRIRMMPPRAILTRLEQSLQVLAGGAVDLPERQQTMRGAIDWSYRLLNPDEQVLFNRLGVFVGGFTLEDIEAVCNPEGELDVFTGLEMLLRNNLLRTVDTSYDEARFDMLQTIRQYALEKLEERGGAQDGELHQYRQAHAAYFGKKAHDMSNQMFARQSVMWLDRLNEDLDNFRAALAWSLQHKDAIGIAVQICTWFFWFWYRRGHFHEGRAWSQRTLDALEGNGNPIFKAMLLNALSAMAMWEGDLSFAASHQEEALAIVEKLNYEKGIAYIKFGYGVILINQGRDAQAYPQLVSAAEMSDEFGDPWQKGTALVHLANVALGLGEFEQARLRLDQALPIIQEIGDPWQMAFCLNNYGELYRVQGEYGKAEVYYQQTREYYQEADAMGDQARLVYTFGFLALHNGDLEGAEVLFKESLEDFRKLGNKRGIAECLAGLARLAVEQGHPEWAAPLLSAAGSQMQKSGAAWWPADRVEVEKTLELLVTRLGEVRFQQLMEQGKEMNLEQAVAYVSNMPVNQD